jgi:hypothetical protein
MKDLSLTKFVHYLNNNRKPNKGRVIQLIPIVKVGRIATKKVVKVRNYKGVVVNTFKDTGSKDKVIGYKRIYHPNMKSNYRQSQINNITKTLE